MGEGYGADLLSRSPPLPTAFLFFFFGCRWVFLGAPRLSLVAVSRGYFSLGRKASRCGGFSCFGSWLYSNVSVVVVRKLSCTWHVKSSLTRDHTQVLCTGRWILNHWTPREVLNSIFFLNQTSIMASESQTHSLTLWNNSPQSQLHPLCLYLTNAATLLVSEFPASDETDSSSRSALFTVMSDFSQ